MPGTKRVGEFCKGSDVINKAVSGSTAYQWREGGKNSVADAFAAAGAGVTHVWASVGGNDVSCNEFFCCSLSGLVGSSERIRAVQVQM